MKKDGREASYSKPPCLSLAMRCSGVTTEWKTQWNPPDRAINPGETLTEGLEFDLTLEPTKCGFQLRVKFWFLKIQ